MRSDSDFERDVENEEDALSKLPRIPLRLTKGGNREWPITSGHCTIACC